MYLKQWWPFLKLAQIFGCFPFKKSKKNPCGLTAIKSKTYLALFVFMNGLQHMQIFIFFAYFAYFYPEKIIYSLQVTVTHGSIIDTVIYGSMMISLYSLQITIMSKIYTGWNLQFVNVLDAIESRNILKCKVSILKRYNFWSILKLRMVLTDQLFLTIFAKFTLGIKIV